MERPQSNGLVEIRGSEGREQGFNCMELIRFLTYDDAVKDWDVWHGAHEEAKAGRCPYRQECKIYKRTTANVKPLFFFNL